MFQTTFVTLESEANHSNEVSYESKTTFIEEHTNNVYYVQAAHGANRICRCSGGLLELCLCHSLGQILNQCTIQLCQSADLGMLACCILILNSL